MQNVTDRVSNPFGMRAPGDESRAVYGYGDANAHFHVVGDHPGVHGGIETGVPFTGSEAGRRVQRALHRVGLLAEPYSDRPDVRNVFFSYLHLVAPPEGSEPTEAEYADMERFFDAELRAITAHVLLPVGERAVRHVLATCTARSVDDLDVDTLHATEVRSGGWLVVPAKEPRDWTGDDEERLVAALEGVLSTDYRRESDLGRFLAGPEPYTVR